MSGQLDTRSTVAREGTRFARGQVSAVAATLAEWACIWLLVALGTWYVAATLAGAVTGALTDLAIKRFWVFHTAGLPVAGEVLRYALVSGTSALCMAGMVWLLVEQAHLGVARAVLAGSVVVGVCWNYPLHRYFVFRPVTAAPPRTPS